MSRSTFRRLDSTGHFDLRFRHLRYPRLNSRVICSASGPVRSAIRQPLALGPYRRLTGALFVLNAKLGAVRITEIKLGKVAVQMFLAAMLINAAHATFED